LGCRIGTGVEALTVRGAWGTGVEVPRGCGFGFGVGFGFTVTGTWVGGCEVPGTGAATGGLAVDGASKAARQK
jgi:hypothetical protein